MSSINLKQVIVIRKDLGMRKGKMCAQVAHAAIDSYLKSDKSDIEVWESECFYRKIVLYVSSEEELRAVHATAIAEGCKGVSKVIIDEGFTEFNGVKTATAFAIGPDIDTRINEVTSHLKLL